MNRLNFVRNLNKKRGKYWWVIFNNKDEWLGKIEFYHAWNKYVWSMEPGSFFDDECTEEVLKFLKLRNQKKDED